MIYNSDLRIGNLINYSEDGSLCNVLAIDGLGLSVNVIKTQEITWVELDQFEPIPLTPEIFEKCGFVPNAIGQLAIEILGIDTHLELVSIIDDYCYLNLNQVGEFGSIQDVSINRIKYLHQLQNLYYALTQTELIVNL